MLHVVPSVLLVLVCMLITFCRGGGGGGAYCCCQQVSSSNIVHSQSMAQACIWTAARDRHRILAGACLVVWCMATGAPA